MIRSKLPNIGTSIFSVMSEMANEYRAINLSQGFPDFQVSERLIELVYQQMMYGKNQYAPMPGIMPLREKIAEKVFESFNHQYNPETEITITAGATEALYATISAVIQEDDEVIILEPAYDSYVPAIRMNGGTPIFLQMKLPDYKVDWNELNKAITQRTRMIIINTPHNPSGMVFTHEDMERLQKAVLSSKILILSDEVYEHIIFDGVAHQSVARYPQLIERSIIVGSFGKTFHTTGWKTGFCLAPAEITKEIRKIHQFMVYAVNTPIQYAVSLFMDHKEEIAKLPTLFQEKRDLFLSMLKGSSYKFTPSHGTYFQVLDYSDISQDNDMEFAEKLTKEFGIASIPMSAFYTNKPKLHLLRFCFAKSDDTLKRAVERLLIAESKLKSK